MIRLVVDCIGFPDSSRVDVDRWEPFLKALGASGEVELILLDRGNKPQIHGARAVPFPEYRVTAAPQDSLLIQQICDAFNADVFISTGMTSPVGTPTVLVANDSMVRSLAGDADERIRLETETTIAFALGYVCTGPGTSDLIASMQPEVPRDRILTILPPAAIEEHTGIFGSCAQGISRDVRAVTSSLIWLLEALADDRRAGAFQTFFSEWRWTRIAEARLTSLFDCAEEQLDRATPQRIGTETPLPPRGGQAEVGKGDPI